MFMTTSWNMLSWSWSAKVMQLFSAVLPMRATDVLQIEVTQHSIPHIGANDLRQTFNVDVLDVATGRVHSASSSTQPHTRWTNNDLRAPGRSVCSLELVHGTPLCSQITVGVI